MWRQPKAVWAVALAGTGRPSTASTPTGCGPTSRSGAACSSPATRPRSSTTPPSLVNGRRVEVTKTYDGAWTPLVDEETWNGVARHPARPQPRQVHHVRDRAPGLRRLPLRPVRASAARAEPAHGLEQLDVLRCQQGVEVEQVFDPCRQSMFTARQAGRPRRREQAQRSRVVEYANPPRGSGTQSSHVRTSTIRSKRATRCHREM